MIYKYLAATPASLELLRSEGTTSHYTHTSEDPFDFNAVIIESAPNADEEDRFRSALTAMSCQSLDITHAISSVGRFDESRGRKLQSEVD